MALTEALRREMEAHRVINYQAIRRCEYKEISHVHIQGPLQYRGEGNSNIVLALAEGVQVARLPKVRVGESSSSDWSRERKQLEREVVFANEVFGRLIGPEFVGIVTIVKFTPAQTAKLNEYIREIRPAYRLHKELGVPYGTCHSDFARIHSDPSPSIDYCVEVKPKQGWCVKSVLDESTKLCTFCLNQFLKIKIGKIASRSAYCPLDLFSGNPLRMIDAVVALLRNPQNNFRIFRNGYLVYGDGACEIGSLDCILEEWFSTHTCDKLRIPFSAAGKKERNLLNFVYILCLALIQPHHEGSKGSRAGKVESFELFDNLKVRIKETLLRSFTNWMEQASEDFHKKVCDANSDKLPEDSILSRVLYVQKLGKWGVGRIYKLYPKFCPYHQTRTSSVKESNCPSKECLLGDRWLDEIPIDPNSMSELDVLCLEHYLLAATAKDCSVMVTFSPIQDTTQNSRFPVIKDMDGNKHLLKIGVADLDPKPVTSIARHYIRDVDMRQASPLESLPQPLT